MKKNMLIGGLVVAAIVLGTYAIIGSNKEENLKFDKSFDGVITEVKNGNLEVMPLNTSKINKNVVSVKLNNNDDYNVNDIISVKYEKINEDIIDDNNIEKIYEVKFEGKIDSIENGTAIVIPNGDEQYILSSGDKVKVNISSDNFKVNDEVVITYDGSIMESYPLQINLIKIERK